MKQNSFFVDISLKIWYTIENTEQHADRQLSDIE